MNPHQEPSNKFKVFTIQVPGDTPLCVVADDREDAQCIAYDVEYILQYSDDNDRVFH